MAVHPSRRSVLGLLGAVPVVAGAAFLAGPAFADGTDAKGSRSGRIPDGLRPGGELDQFVADKAATDEFSGSLLLTNHGRTVLARSYGKADKQRGVANGPDTAFALASVTKLFTAVAIAQLAQEKKVAYQEKLGTYLDGFPEAIAGATVHHLLTHTSGLDDYHGMPGYLEEAATWTSAEQVMTGTTDYIRRSQPLFAPGAGWSYSNSAYHLLGEIVARASGVSYYDYVRQHVFAAAGMTRTDFITKPQWQTDRRTAHPYYRGAQGQWVDGIANLDFIGTPAGDAFSTCADMDRFARHLYQERLLTPGHTRLMLSGKVPPAAPTQPPGLPQPPQNGTPAEAVYQCYGPIGSLVGGQWMFEHGGGNTSGESTFVQFYPETGWVLVVLSNYADAAPAVARLARGLIVAA
jgi:CubicO group peptidase (beta-lactamase class C family)